MSSAKHEAIRLQTLGLLVSVGSASTKTICNELNEPQWRVYDVLMRMEVNSEIASDKSSKPALWRVQAQ